ncbi:UNVERIFIED_ORG: hypothetical protein ABIC54_006540 [Burkholderia sp. 1263]
MSSHVRQPCLRSVHRPQREVGKRKRLKPPALKWVSWLGGDRGASGIGALAHSAFVTRQSFFRRRCARRRGTSSNRRRLPQSAVVLQTVGSSCGQQSFFGPQAASAVNSRSANRRQLPRSAVVLRTAGSFAVSSRSATGSAACAERVGARGRTVSADPQPAPKNQRHVRNSRLFSAPRRGEADGQHRAQAKPLVCRRTLPASTQCEAGRMTALSRASNARGHRFQMHHDPLQARGPASKLAV